MAAFKCKMCGGELKLFDSSTVAECEYCGSKQTVPNADNEQKMALYTRANRLRMDNEFDKAAGIYESIIADFPKEAEAYWGLVLCKYGIEYVDDPVTAKKIPTCRRSSFDSVFDDENFGQTLENADTLARSTYRAEAEQIEEIRRGIVEVSNREEPYDIFICYKETDANGNRTVDSVMAQSIYDLLNDKGYRVFFSRITLEEKIGSEYEPYIFAALNSAKIMLVFGTDYEYFNAVWVKNEWNRFLQLIAKGEKKTLIPCYKDIDAYDMPKEFARLQAQDMGKLGWEQDLIRGVQKILPKNEATAEKKFSPVQNLLKRGYLALEDGEWLNADRFFEDVLNVDAECAEGYLGKMLCALRLHKEEELGKLTFPFDTQKYYDKVMRFASRDLQKRILCYSDAAKRRATEKNAPFYTDESDTRLAEIRERLYPLQAIIHAGYKYSVGVNSDGTVSLFALEKAAFSNGVEEWRDIVAVTGGNKSIIGLKSDGTVVSAGSTKNCNVSAWRDIVAVSASTDHTLGLKADGTVVSATNSLVRALKTDDWTDITAVTVGNAHAVGIKNDRTVVACGINTNMQCNVSRWNDIVAVSAGALYTVGLKSDGTVVSAGMTIYQQQEMLKWKNIIAVSAGANHTAALSADGRVVAVGNNDCGQCNVSGWREIIAISVGINQTLGLKSDGTVVFAGKPAQVKEKVTEWKLFDHIEDFERKPFFIQQRQKAQQRETGNADLIKKRAELRRKGVCQHCGGAFKGMLTRSCSVCGKKKDY